MMLTRLILVGAWLALVGGHGMAQDNPTVVLIGHPSVPRLNAAAAQRLYTGRAVEAGGVPIVVVNAPSGTTLRERFLATVMEEDDARYTAYWTVRRHVGKGTPPREMSTAAEIIGFVQNTPGGVGYVFAGDLRPGLNIVFRP